MARQSPLSSAPPIGSNGVPLLPISDDKARVTLDIVNAWRDEVPHDVNGSEDRTGLEASNAHGRKY